MNNDYLGYVYVAEEANADSRTVTSLDVVDKGSVFFVSFDTVLHSFGVINRNSRQYLGDNVMDSINKSPKIQACLADNAWYGEQNHPMQLTVNDKLTPERLQDIFMPNRSHKIMRPKRVGNLLQAHIETASGTEAGRGFACEIIQGLKPAFSCRAIAFMQNHNGKPTVFIRKLITYDWVLYPSHKEAHAITTPQGNVKKVNSLIAESTNENTITQQDVMIPLHEILGYVSEKDVPTNMIMESFNLGPESLVGFDKQRKHVMMRDRTNMLYINISPETKEEVDDFFGSFN